MRDYSKVSPQFWIGSTGKKLRKAGTECQLVALYLLTCSHANMLGMYYLPKMYIAHECGLTLEGACKGLARAIEAGFCAYDEDAEVVWVYEMAAYQIGEQLKDKDKRVSGVQNEYDATPECQHLRAFHDKYKDAFLMSGARGLQAPSKPLGSQEQEQEQKQEQEQEQAQKSSPARQAAAGADKPDTELQAACKLTWQAYTDAFFVRYGVEPIRNAKVSSLVKQFVQRVGHAVAPHVAAFYVQHNGNFYVQKTHPVELLLKDAEGLHTQWATGRTMTATRAKQIDGAQANASVADEALALLESWEQPA